MSIVTLLVLLLVISAVGGFWGNMPPRAYGYYSWSPLAVVLLIVIFLWLFDAPHMRSHWLR